MRQQLENALLQAKALIGQLEAMAQEMDSDDDAIKCPKCQTTHVQEIEHSPTELWRIKCVRCDAVYAEPRTAPGMH